MKACYNQKKLVDIRISEERERAWSKKVMRRQKYVIKSLEMRYDCLKVLAQA